MSTNYVEAASLVDGELPTVVDEKLSSATAEKATVASPETASVAVEEQPATTDRTSHPIAHDEKAIVEEEIRPGESGRVRFQSSWWSARSDRDITFCPGEAVRVVAIDNITLIVEEG